jgi:GAF domain-containing protein
MDSTPESGASAAPNSLATFRKASQAVHATQELDQVLTRVIAELHAALDAEAASVALLDRKGSEIILYAAGPVAEAVNGLRLPLERGVVGWVVSKGQAVIVNDVSTDPRFWPDVDGYSGFETRSVLCAPLLSGNKVIGAVEVLNKCHGDFSTEDLNFLEAFSAVAASAIENARRFRQEQQRRREADTLRQAWGALTTPRDLEALFDVILDQLAKLVAYRSASILLVTEDGGLELGASRGIDDLAEAAQVVSRLGLDSKVRTMLETRQPLLIPDTRTDPRWRHFPQFSYIRSWIGAPLLIKGHLVGTLNVDHDQPGYYTADHARLVSSFAHQAAIAIENSRLYAATREATLQLAEQAQRTVTLYETSRALLSGLELNQAALRELVGRIADLTKARYGILDILPENSQSPLLITVGFTEAEIADLDLAHLKRNVLDLLSSEREVMRRAELGGIAGVFLDSFLGVAIHARGRTLGRLLLVGKRGNRAFSRDDEALALTLATNLASAIENASLYHKTQQRLRELAALYEISCTVTEMDDIGDIYTQLTVLLAGLLDAERCVFFIYRDGWLECQPPGYGVPPEFIPQLSFPVAEDDPLYPVIHTIRPLISNDVMRDPDLLAQRGLLTQLGLRRLLACRIPIDGGRFGFLVAADKRGGEEFSEQDRHLVSIIVHQVSSVVQRALLQSRQQQETQIQSALLQVSQAISSLTNLDELLQAVAQITHQLAGCDHCLIAPWEERHAAFIPRAQSGLDPALNDVLSQVQFVPGDLPFIDRTTESRAPLLLTRQEMREMVPAWTQGILGTESSLIVPLVTQERVVGLIAAAYTRESHLPGEREIALVTGIARQAAIAIENASLYQDLQLHAASLERAYRELKELDEHKTQFIQNVSHELRTPFTLIKGYLELLLDEDMGSLNEGQREALETLTERTEVLGRLINDIIAIQFIDATSLNLHEFELGALVQATLENVRGRAPKVHLQSELPPDLPLVKADLSLVERALEHLLDNAIKFSPEGGLITLRARLEGEMLHVEVEDRGIGIPAQALPYVFDRFYQADGSTTRRFGGAGLGLTIVKQIIEAHGGQVGVHSAEGQGSIFYLTLPLASPSRPPA